MSATITAFPNPDEVIEPGFEEYDAGFAEAERIVLSFRETLNGKGEEFAAGFYDRIFCLFDEG